MKAVFGILALFLVAANAGIIEEPVNYEGLISGIINEAKKAAIDSVHQLEHQVEEIVLAPLHQIEEAFENIQARIIEGEACVVAEGHHAETVVTEMHQEMSHCGVVAAKDTAQIAIDVSKSAHQLVFDGYDLLKTYRKCKGYTNSILQKTCKAAFTVKSGLYILNARSSINTIKAAPSRVPIVITDADNCTHSAADKALFEFDVVQKNMDACFGIN